MATVCVVCADRTTCISGVASARLGGMVPQQPMLVVQQMTAAATRGRRDRGLLQSRGCTTVLAVCTCVGTFLIQAHLRTHVLAVCQERAASGTRENRQHSMGQQVSGAGVSSRVCKQVLPETRLQRLQGTAATHACTTEAGMGQSLPSLARCAAHMWHMYHES